MSDEFTTIWKKIHVYYNFRYIWWCASWDWSQWRWCGFLIIVVLGYTQSKRDNPKYMYNVRDFRTVQYTLSYKLVLHKLERQNLTYTHSVSVMVFSATFKNILASSGGVKLVLWTQTILKYDSPSLLSAVYYE